MVAKSINFVEFLTAAEDELLVNTLKPDNLKSLQTVAHEKLWQLLKEYFITGGMPQVIEEYLNIRSTPVEDPDSPPLMIRALLNSINLHILTRTVGNWIDMTKFVMLSSPSRIMS